ncbi:MAG: hypothetical protein ACP5N2_03865 [Candidatus Nanoarchaeia archaeon]
MNLLDLVFPKKEKKEAPIIDEASFKSLISQTLSQEGHMEFYVDGQWVSNHNASATQIRYMSNGKSIVIDMAPGIIRSGISIDYASSWGIDRLLLDGIQNHLPSDSKGTKVDVQFLVNNTWISYKNHFSGKIKKIKFVDDGTGYTPQSLEILDSSKKEDEEAVGHNGEGLKMISAAAIRMGVDLELHSKDWSATPDVENYRKDDSRLVERLIYHIKPSELMIGSETIFHTVTKEMIAYAKNLEDKVLQLRTNYAPLIKSNSGHEIVDLKGTLFGKGSFVTDDLKNKLLFSYNINKHPNRDRDVFTENNLQPSLEDIWETILYSKYGDQEDQSKIILKHLLNVAHNYPEIFSQSMECSILDSMSYALNGNISTVFKEMYGENAIAVSDNKLESLYAKLGFTPILLKEEFLVKALSKEMGLDMSKMNLFQTYFNYNPQPISKSSEASEMKTDLSLKGRIESWSEKRILLDLISNHLPSDSGGKKTTVKVHHITYSTNEEQVFTLGTKFEGSKIRTINKIVIEDDGKGFDYKNLGIHHSTKSDAIGKFGEGLKFASGASLIKSINISYRSKDWLAGAIKIPDKLNDENIDLLGYLVLQGIPSMKGSTTILSNLNSAFKELIENHQQYLLYFNKDIVRIGDSNIGTIILEGVETPSTFVKGIHITNNTWSTLRTVFSYDLNNPKLSPDRDQVDYADMEKSVKTILEQNTNPAVVKNLLSTYKQKQEDNSHLEYRIELDLGIKQKELWKKTAENVFGDMTALATGIPSFDYEAEHQGYTLMHPPKGLSKTLESAGFRTARDIAFRTFDIDVISVDDLNAQEKEVYEFINNVKNDAGYKQIILYNPLSVNDSKAFWDPKKPGVVHIAREKLASIYTAVRSYVHESGHDETKLPDPDDGFRGFFEDLLTRNLIEKYSKKDA